jgi:thiol-disulfide isomerase/thioredoxin
MKKQLLIISALFISMLSFSQGIVFEKGTWKQVLAKAKQTNKPIFVDVYTTWCGPCKIMSKDIFPLAEVGKVYNANYVCYQIDAEKGEGIEFAKKYEVKAYPTYLFIKADGTVFSSALGSMPEVRFLEVSKIALADLKDPKSMEIWDKEYLSKKTDPAFLLSYMDKRDKLGKSNAQLFDEYLKALPEDERVSSDIVKLYARKQQELKIATFAFDNLLNNRVKFLSKNLNSVDNLIALCINNSANEAAKTKNEKLYLTVLSVYDQLPKESKKIERDIISINYYSKTDDLANLAKATTNYCNNNLMKISIDSISKIDKLNLEKLEKQLASNSQNKMDSVQLKRLKASITDNEKKNLASSLNNYAWIVFQKISDVNFLQDALKWSERSLQLTPTNGYYMDTYANLLYKLGRKDEAIAKYEYAVHYFTDVEKGDTNGFKDSIAKIKAGEKTW